MARPRANLPDSAAIKALADAQGRLPVRVTPGARTEQIEVGETMLAVKLRAKPQDGAANTALIRIVAKALGCAPSEVDLLRGATGRDKLLGIPME